MKKVSVIIPCFNSERFLFNTLASVKDQEYENIEIIIIDDGSTDSSVKIAQEFKAKEIKVFSQVKKGACAARNFGLSLATGEYIMFLDSDDLISKNKIGEQVRVIQKYGNETLPFCGWGRFFKSIDDFVFEDQIINKFYEKPVQYLIDCWSGKGMWQTSVFLMHRDLVEKAGRWNEELIINQDGEFFARVILKAKKLLFTEGEVYYRSGNKNSISGSEKTFEKAASLLKSYQLYQKHLIPQFSLKGLKEALGANYVSFFYQFYDQYPELALQAYEDFFQLNVPVKNGGRGFKILAPLFGIKGALKIKSLLKRKRNHLPDHLE